MKAGQCYDGASPLSESAACHPDDSRVSPRPGRISVQQAPRADLLVLGCDVILLEHAPVWRASRI